MTPESFQRYESLWNIIHNLLYFIEDVCMHYTLYLNKKKTKRIKWRDAAIGGMGE